MASRGPGPRSDWTEEGRGSGRDPGSPMPMKHYCRFGDELSPADGGDDRFVVDAIALTITRQD